MQGTQVVPPCAPRGLRSAGLEDINKKVLRVGVKPYVIFSALETENTSVKLS